MTAILTPIRLPTIDDIDRIMRRPDGTIRKKKTTPELWHRLRSFEGYVRDIPEMALSLLRFAAWVHQGKCWIPDKNKSGKLSIMVPNRGQIMVMDAMLEQAIDRRPVRIIIPKSRRQGVSTITDETILFLCAHNENKNAKLVAHQKDSADGIFEITRMSWARMLGDRKRKQISYQSIPMTKILFEDTQSEFHSLTGMGRHKGSGAKTDYLHISELAKFEFTSKQDEKALDSLLITVTDGDPNTLIVIESTGQGTAGEFPKRVRAATGADKTGDEDEDDTESPYRCVFLPWMIDPMCQSRKAPESFDDFKRKLDGYELVLKDDFGCTPAQIQWRREKLRERGIRTYGENPVNFCHEFPAVVDDIFKTQAGRVYPMMNPEFPKMQELPNSFFSQFSTHTRAIDWGFSRESPFVCLWIVIDPDKPAGLVVSPSCQNLWEEFQNYCYDPVTGDPVKQFDHGLDSLRYAVSTFRPRGLLYVRREMFIRDFGSNNSPQEIARRIHVESGYVHASGDVTHPDVSKFIRGPNSFEYQTGVADRARRDLINQFTSWNIPLMGYRSPHEKDSGKGMVHDGIAMVQALAAGNVIFDPEEEDRDTILANIAARKLRSSREWPTDEEFAAYERKKEEALGEDYRSNTRQRRLSNTGWAEIVG